MRIVVAAVVLLVALPAGAQAPGAADAVTDGVPFELDGNATVADLRALAADVSGASIHACVSDVTLGAPDSYRLMGTPTHDAFVAKYRNVFGELGLKTALQTFTDGGPGVGVTVPTGGTNIVGVLPGRDLQRWVVVGGHYDTREATFGGGALDNASGICTVRELARAFKAASDRQTLEATVVFLWYDGEEWGLYGSIAFAKDHSVAAGLLGLNATDRIDILLSQSFDMPGLNYPAMNNWVQYGNATDVSKTAVLNLRTAPIHADDDWACFSYGCYQDLKARPDFPAILANNTNYQFLVREVAYDLLRLPPQYIWVYDDAYGRSDHVPLIAMGHAGMRIQGSHDAEYPHYHQPTDTLAALEVEAGGKDLLVAGYDTEARIGGTVAYYAARTGSLGHYGYVHDAALLPGTGPASTSSSTPPHSTNLPIAPAFAGLMAVALLRRHSTGRKP
ncbi:MAG: M28 family peptidase [bacterium]